MPDQSARRCGRCGLAHDVLIPGVAEEADELYGRVRQLVEADPEAAITGVGLYYRLWNGLASEHNTRRALAAGMPVPIDPVSEARERRPDELEYYRRRESVQSFLTGLFRPVAHNCGFPWFPAGQYVDGMAGYRISVSASSAYVTFYQRRADDDECFHWHKLPPIEILDAWIREPFGGRPTPLEALVKEILDVRSEA